MRYIQKQCNPFTLISHPYISLISTPLFHIQNLLNLLRLPLRWRPTTTKSTVLARIRVSSPRASWHGLTTLRSPHIHGLWVLLSLGVDANINGSIKTVRNRLADKADLHDWVITALLAHVEEEVLGVESLFLGVGAVGCRLLDLAEEVLLDVELAGVGNGAALDGVVGKELGAVMDDGWEQSVTMLDGCSRQCVTYCEDGWRGRHSDQG